MKYNYKEKFENSNPIGKLEANAELFLYKRVLHAKV